MGRDVPSKEQRFRRIQPLIERALDLEGEARRDFVALCAELYPDLATALRAALEEDSDLPVLNQLADRAVAAVTRQRRGLRVGSWRLLEKIGEGGMGSVYRAERADGAFEKEVAIKLLHGGGQRFAAQLERERQLLARLDHPGIARLIDGGTLPDGQPWLALELVGGRALNVWLQAEQPSAALRLQVFAAICAAVAHAHEAGLLHLDIKPENVRVIQSGRIKLLDFGTASLLQAHAERQDSRLLTPEFAAPEQLRGEALTPATDIHALGGLLYFLFSGQAPRAPARERWSEYVAQASLAPAPQLMASRSARESFTDAFCALADELIARSMAPDPRARFPSVLRLAAAVQNQLAEKLPGAGMKKPGA